MQSVMTRVRQQWQTATLTDAAWIAFCTLLFCGAKLAGKQFHESPGHAGAFWIPSLFLARATVGRSGAATMTALLGSSVWCLSGASGSFNVAAYVAGGLVLDALDFDAKRLRRLHWALIGGVLCHLAKFGYHVLPSLVFGLSANSIVKWGASLVIVQYIVFGLMGGLGGWMLLQASDRMKARRRS